MSLPTLRARFAEDVRTMLRRDPAARGTLDAVCHSPGLHAIWIHSVAHRWWQQGMTFAARQLSHTARAVTGIEIHPGATIGRRFAIDHGMGVVIGETSQIGDDVLLYQGVTLGGTSLQPVKRHPTLGDGVVVGAGATILGAVSIGDGAKIGAGAIVVRDVPPGATVVGVEGHVIDRRPSEHRHPAASGTSPGRELRAIDALTERVDELETRLHDAVLSVPPSESPTVSHGGGI